LDKLIDVLSNTNKVEDSEDKDTEEKKPEEDKEDVEKEGDGEKVKLPESAGDETSQDKPAEGAKSDEGGANFLEKEGIEKMKADIKKEVMKDLQDKRADTPRAGVKSNDIQKAEVAKAPKSWAEANRMVKKAGLN